MFSRSTSHGQVEETILGTVCSVHADFHWLVCDLDSHVRKHLFDTLHHGGVLFGILGMGGDYCCSHLKVDVVTYSCPHDLDVLADLRPLLLGVGMIQQLLSLKYKHFRRR